jgi:hypothetical protein
MEFEELAFEELTFAELTECWHLFDPQFLDHLLQGLVILGLKAC